MTLTDIIHISYVLFARHVRVICAPDSTEIANFHDLLLGLKRPKSKASTFFPCNYWHVFFDFCGHIAIFGRSFDMYGANMWIQSPNIHTNAKHKYKQNINISTNTMNDSYFVWLATALMNHFNVKVNGLAALLGVNYSYLNRMIKHDIPSNKYITLLEAKAAEVGIDYIYQKRAMANHKPMVVSDTPQNLIEHVAKGMSMNSDCKYKMIIELDMNHGSVTSQKISLIPQA